MVLKRLQSEKFNASLNLCIAMKQEVLWKQQVETIALKT